MSILVRLGEGKLEPRGWDVPYDAESEHGDFFHRMFVSDREFSASRTIEHSARLASSLMEKKGRVYWNDREAEEGIYVKGLLSFTMPSAGFCSRFA